MAKSLAAVALIAVLAGRAGAEDCAASAARCTLVRESGVQKYPSPTVFSACACKIDLAKAAKKTEEQLDAEDILRVLMRQEVDQTKVGKPQKKTVTIDGKRITMESSESTISVPNKLGTEIIAYMDKNKIPFFAPAPSGATFSNGEEVKTETTPEKPKTTTGAGTTQPSPEDFLRPTDTGGPKGGAEADKLEERVVSQATVIPSGDRGAAANVLESQEKALEGSNSRDAGRFTEIGAKFNAIGRPEQALRTLDKAVDLRPDDPAALGERAKARALAGDREGALADARKTLALDPRNRLASLILGHSDELQHAAKGIGSRKLEFGADAWPDSVKMKDRHSGLEAKGAGTLGTLALAGALPPAAPSGGASSPSQLLVKKAFLKMKLHDYKDALADATAATRADARNPYAWLIRSEVHNQLKEYRAAIEDADKALELSAAIVQALRAKAYAELQQGQLDAAMADIQRAIKLEADNGVGYLYRAMIYEKLQRTEEALKDYDKADDLDPSLAPLSAAAFERLGAKPGATLGAAAPEEPRAKTRRLLRAGAITLAAGLLIFGLAGRLKGPRAPSEAGDPS